LGQKEIHPDARSIVKEIATMAGYVYPPKKSKPKKKAAASKKKKKK